MPTPVRRSLAAATLALLVPTLAACGFNEQTDQVYQPSVGVNNRQGTVDVLAAVVVSGSVGSGTFVTSLSNESETKTIKLTQVTAANGVQAQLVKPIEVKPQQLVNLADQGAVSVTGKNVAAGGFVRLTLTFDDGESAMVNAPVVSRDGDYSEVAPAVPSSSSSPSSSASSSPSSSATPSTSP